MMDLIGTFEKAQNMINSVNKPLQIVVAGNFIDLYDIMFKDGSTTSILRNMLKYKSYEVGYINYIN